MPTQEYQQQMDPAHVIADLNARVRSLENKYNTLTERLLVVNQNMIEEYKKTLKEIKELKTDTRKTRLDITNTQDVIKDIVKEMTIFAKKDDVKVLEKYMNLINILKLVTNEELDEKLEEIKLEIKPNIKKSNMNNLKNTIIKSEQQINKDQKVNP
tara:strand:+ start:76 stop:543 length:468 start_codon:yes stop_codon:yes gene_type:complete